MQAKQSEELNMLMQYSKFRHLASSQKKFQIIGIVATKTRLIMQFHIISPSRSIVAIFIFGNLQILAVFYVSPSLIRKLSFTFLQLVT